MRHILTNFVATSSFGVILLAALVGAACGAVIALLAAPGDNLDPQELSALIDASVEFAVSESVEQAMLDSRQQLAVEVDARLQSDQQRIVDIFSQVSQSVVVIDAEGASRENDEGVTIVPAALATGFVLDNAGHIVTAAHVLEDMVRFTVIMPNGERLAAERVGDDRPFSDVAVLRVEPDSDSAWIVPDFGSTASITTGETVLAIGNTLLGQEIALTVGVVSDPDTTFFRERYEQVNLIQTDAALNHGNSGGILVDMDGKIVGMNAVIARQTRDGGFIDGVGFAVQIDAVLEVARGIAADGFFPRPSFGVVDERLLTPTAAAQLELDVTEGSFLIELTRLGAFARAGIRPGDVVQEMNGIAVNDEAPYLNVLSTLEPNVPVVVRIHRGGEEYRLSIAPDLRAP